MVSRFLHLAGALAIAGALVGIGASPASAHAALLDSDPADGSSVATAPTTVTFTFNEVVGNAAVAVTAPDGTSAAVSDIRAVDRQVSAKIEDVDQRGTYSASYRVVSADGHPVEGTVTYEVTTGRAVTQQVPQQTEDDSFIHRHRSHLFWGILAVGIGLVLLLEPFRRRDDTDDT